MTEQTLTETVDNVVNEWIANMLRECNVPLRKSVAEQTEYLLRPEGLGLGMEGLDSIALTPTERALKNRLSPQQRKRKTGQQTEKRVDTEEAEETKLNTRKRKKRKIVHKDT